MLALVASADGTLHARADAGEGPPGGALPGRHPRRRDRRQGRRLLAAARAARRQGARRARSRSVTARLRAGLQRRRPRALRRTTTAPTSAAPRRWAGASTAQNLNLNRDYVKADAPEMRAMLGAARRVGPDRSTSTSTSPTARSSSTTSRSRSSPSTLGPAALRPLGQALRDALFARLDGAGAPAARLLSRRSTKATTRPRASRSASPPPRFAHGYWALRNRFGVLVETHSWKDYATAVKTTRDVVGAPRARARRQGMAWRRAAATREPPTAPPRRMRSRSPTKPTGGRTDRLPRLRLRPRGLGGLRQAIVATTTPSRRSGRCRSRAEVARARSRPPPAAGYLVPPAYAAPWSGSSCALHGFTFEEARHRRRSRRRGLPRQRGEASGRTSYEGHQTADAEGAGSRSSAPSPPARSSCPRAAGARLLGTSSSPRRPTRFLAWGFFNAAFEQKEYIEDYVLEAVGGVLGRTRRCGQFEEQLADRRSRRTPRRGSPSSPSATRRGTSGTTSTRSGGPSRLRRSADRVVPISDAPLRPRLRFSARVASRREVGALPH